MQLVPSASSKAYTIPVFFESIFDIPDMFGEQSSHADVFASVALSLVTDLVQGKNGLLFT